MVDCYKKHFLCTELIPCYYNLWYKMEKKNSLKLSLKEMEETSTPVHLCVIMQSAWESVANAIKVELTTLEMN